MSSDTFLGVAAVVCQHGQDAAGWQRLVSFERRQPESCGVTTFNC